MYDKTHPKMKNNYSLPFLLYYSTTFSANSRGIQFQIRFCKRKHLIPHSVSENIVACLFTFAKSELDEKDVKVNHCYYLSAENCDDKITGKKLDN